MVQNQTTSAPGMFTWITITMILALSILYILRPLPVTDAFVPFTGPLEFERSAGSIAALFLAVFFICFPLLESGACELEPNPIGLWYCIPSQNNDLLMIRYESYFDIVRCWNAQKDAKVWSFWLRFRFVRLLPPWVAVIYNLRKSLPKVV